MVAIPLDVSSACHEANHKEFIMKTRLIDTLSDEVLDALFAVWTEEGTQLAFEFWVEENYYPEWLADHQ